MNVDEGRSKEIDRSRLCRVTFVCLYGRLSYNHDSQLLHIAARGYRNEYAFEYNGDPCTREPSFTVRCVS